MTDTEQWRTAVYDGIVYEGLYKVSNFGRILSLDYNHTGKPGLMTPHKRKNGYLQVKLWKNGEKKTCLVHRLVAFTFLENPDNLPEVNHIDENKTNNFVGTPENDYKDGNIEWKSHRGNINHGTRTERMAKTKSKKVLQLSLDGDLIREWPSTQECERNGFDHSHVVDCCNGKRKTHKGFRFMYADDYKEQQFKEFSCLPLW